MHYCGEVALKLALYLIPIDKTQMFRVDLITNASIFLYYWLMFGFGHVTYR